MNRATKNKASKRVVEAMNEIENEPHAPIDYIHSDNDSGFLNEPMTTWYDTHKIRITRSRPHHWQRQPI